MSHQILLAKNTKLNDLIKFIETWKSNDKIYAWSEIKTGERFSEYILNKKGERFFELKNHDVDIDGMIDYFKNKAISEYDIMPGVFHKKYTKEQYIQLIINCDLIPPYFFYDNKLVETTTLKENERLSFFKNFIINNNDEALISVFDLY